MPKGTFFQCETCGQKAFSQIPQTWIHISNFLLQVGKGVYRTTIENYDKEYNHYYDLIFCSLSCLTEWLKAKYPEADTSSNPSQRI